MRLNSFIHLKIFSCTMNNFVISKTQINNCDKTDVPFISVEIIDQAIGKIANNTASSHDGIAIEHLRFAHPSVIVILSKLFNICLRLGVLPQEFCMGIVTPIPKFNSSKKEVSADDFRGISVNPIVSKIFEHCLLPFLDNLTTSNRQYGLRKESAV